MDVLPSARVQQRIRSFFLLYLFVARTLGICPIPQLPENIILTNSALLINEYTDDTEITLTCSNGYVQDGGSAKIKCNNGVWSDPDIICKKKDCGPPPPQMHMTYDTSQGTLFGASAKILCEKGYEILKGSAYKHCYNAGWTGKNTKCEIVTCNLPVAIPNGKSSLASDNKPQYGEKVFYVCDEGYTMTGKDVITCTEEGVYDSTPPQCLGGDVLTAADNTTTTKTSTMPYYSQEDQNDINVDTKKDVGYTPVIISVVCVTLVACVTLLLINKALNKRKGSYDTREDLKPELLQFQNL